MNAPENKKLLVIEDDNSLRNVLHEKLVLENFTVIEARDGEEGLSVALQQHPDLILLDIIMPKMDGISMMKKLRVTDEWGKHVPVILLTNISAEDEKLNQAIAEDEPAYYLVKSNWTIHDLIEKIRERLSRK